MIERDYYPLEEAAEMIGCSMMDLAHLGASERINIIVLTQGLTGQLVKKDGQLFYDVDYLYKTINDRFCLVYKEDLQKWEAINSPYYATVHLEKIKTADNTGNDWYLHNRLTMDCRSMYLLTSDINSLREANSNKQSAPASNEKPFSETERNTMLKLIIGMAMDAYNYDPNSPRNNATGTNKGSIKAGLEKKGINMDDDTIRKYLNEAKNLL